MSVLLITAVTASTAVFGVAHRELQLCMASVRTRRGAIRLLLRGLVALFWRAK